MAVDHAVSRSRRNGSAGNISYKDNALHAVLVAVIAGGLEYTFDLDSTPRAPGQTKLGVKVVHSRFGNDDHADGQAAVADSIAGSSFVELLPPALGVQVEVRFFTTGVELSLCSTLSGSNAACAATKSVRDTKRDRIARKVKVLLSPSLPFFSRYRQVS